MRIKRALAGLALGAIALTGSPASADPLIGSRLVGDYCSAGAAITGEGASFATNAHKEVFIPQYSAQCGEGSVTYLGNGSGAGKLAARDRTRAFGMSDEPLSLDEQLVAAADVGDPTAPNPGGRVSPIHHIPLALGAVAVPYNLAVCGITGQEAISLRSPVLGAIFAGLITEWNDPLLTAENPNLASCNQAITLAVRADVSGTTYAFKDYLSKRFPVFQVYKQNQFNLAWPAEDTGANTPVRGNKNSGVASAIKNNPGSIGYVELSTAQNTGLRWAKVDGATGVFNSPQTSSGGANCELAAAGATFPPTTLSPGWDAVSITDTPNPLAYGICTFTYALVYNNLATGFGGAMSQAQAQTMVDYINLALTPEVQTLLPAHGYAALPIPLQVIGQAGMATVAYL